MCYTISINLTRIELEKRFGVKLEKGRDIHPRYYVSAFQLPFVPVITGVLPDQVQEMQWGLIPFWVKDEKTASEIRLKTFNARAETIIEKPSYREAVNRRRCLVPVSGFYEWHEHMGKKYPFYICRKDRQPIALAGVFDAWINRETGELHNTFSIVTTAANELMEKIHNSKRRMPVILPENLERQWIDPQHALERAMQLAAPFPSEEIQAHPVSKMASPRTPAQDITEAVIEPFYYPELAGTFPMADPGKKGFSA
jgi:putative SOS response-associated peptidase YedK